jgi:hypothetical protein
LLINSALLLSSDNEKLKTNEKITGKYLTKKETPPTHPHRNPVKKACPLLIDHLKITENVFWPNTAHSPANKKPLTGRTKWKNTHTGRNPLLLSPVEPLFCLLHMHK